MSRSIEIRMLDALELFHYSCRFQHRLFVLVVENDTDLRSLITDIRVLTSARIRIIVICQDHDKLEQLLQVWNSRGCPLEYLPAGGDELSETGVHRVHDTLSRGVVPVLGVPAGESPPATDGQMSRLAMDVASHLTVDKVFFLSNQTGLTIDNRFVSHTTPHEIDLLMAGAKRVNIGHERLRELADQNRCHGYDIVLIKGASGNLFQEIFTHRGKGTLLTSDYPNLIRTGRLSDVTEIMLLMKPYIQSGTILPVDEDDLARDIGQYYVYTVNNSIVATARLRDFGVAAELAKFCTLPRYQGKGRARELAEKMIETAKESGKRYIFALSIKQRMFHFFENLGFYPCQRRQLPPEWQRQYDFKRPSQAFRLDIGH